MQQPHHAVEKSKRPAARWLIGPIIALVIIANIGDIMTPQWAEQHPAWLIALNSRSRILALTTNNLDPLSYYGIATFRLLISDPLFYLLGWYYGDSAISWLERRTPTIGELMRTWERWFSYAAYPLVFIAPNNPICLLAGAYGMKPLAFFVTNITGTLVRLWTIRIFGNVFSDPIDGVLGFITQYRLPLTVLAVLWAGWSLRSELRKGAENHAAIGDLSELDDVAGSGDVVSSSQGETASGSPKPPRAADEPDV